MNRFIKMLTAVEHAAVKVEHAAVTVGKVALPIAVPLATHGAVSQATVQAVLGIAVGKGVQENMNPFEQMGFAIVMGAIQASVKNPAHKAALKEQLLGIADDIYQSYGLVPPQHTADAPNAG